jgi:predicted nucleotidyltransferase
MYGDRIERVVLFGSRARGDARPDSDYDIAVFLRDMKDRWDELDKLALMRVDFLDETGAFFDAKPYAATAYRDNSPLMGEIRREGLTL